MNTLNVPEQNINRIDDETTISVTFYIPKCEENKPGYYTYSLKYNKNYKKNGISEEKLTYKEKYSLKKEIEIFKVKNIVESELGTKILYQNNTISSNSDNLIYYKSIYEIFSNKFNVIFDSGHANVLKQYKKDKSFLTALSNLADKKIIDTGIEKKEDNEIVYFLNNDNNKLYFDQLSVGTRKIIVLGIKILEAINNGNILIIDEIENSLHIALSVFLTKFISHSDIYSNAQLIYTTHSPVLPTSLDNDQIYYINNSSENCSITSISDAIKLGLISRDKTISSALVELICSPDEKDIENFFNRE